MGVEYTDDVNDIAFETKATDKAGLALSNSTSDTIFQKAIVLEVINDPAAFRSQKDFDKKYDKATVDNFSFLKRAPRNAVLARTLNDGQGKRSDTVNICLPFFPPHLCFPIKPGEHVWLISPAPTGKAAKVFYWMCRVPTWIDADDINYTHEDRVHHYKGAAVDEADSADKAHNEVPKTKNKDDLEMYGFPNGMADSDGFTFGDNKDEYDIHVTGSLAYKSFKFEPVPRLTKMPGDMVLQGSNNTSITLGTARGFRGGHSFTPDEGAAPGGEDIRLVDFNDEPLTGGEEDKIIRSSATLVDPSVPEATYEGDFAAAIDIVAGRSLRTRGGGDTNPIADADTNPPTVAMEGGHAPAFPRLKKTVNPEDKRGAGLVEVSKNPQGYLEDVKDNQLDHPIEGDPDFRYDASRIYITADSSPDEDFGLAEQLTGMPAGLGNAGTVPVALDGAAVVMKSDHIRIIARKDPDSLAGGAATKINGSIRIIKEGKPRTPADDSKGPPGGERAIIAIEPDGTIIIDGPRVILGNGHMSAPQLDASAESAGPGYTTNDHVYIGGDDAEHSAVLGEELADTLMAFAVDVARMLGATDGGSVSGFGSNAHTSQEATIASIGNSGAPITNGSSTAMISNLKNNLKNCFSKVIKIK